MTPREDNGLWYEFRVPRPPFTNNYQIVSSNLDGSMDRRPRLKERTRQLIPLQNFPFPLMQQPIVTELPPNNEIINIKSVDK